MSHFFIGARFLAHNISCGLANVFVCICEFSLGQIACNLAILIYCVFIANPSSQLLCMCCVFMCSYQIWAWSFQTLTIVVIMFSAPRWLCCKSMSLWLSNKHSIERHWKFNTCTFACNSIFCNRWAILPFSFWYFKVLSWTSEGRCVEVIVVVSFFMPCVVAKGSLLLKVWITLTMTSLMWLTHIVNNLLDVENV